MFNNKRKKYIMSEMFNSEDLFVANLKYIAIENDDDLVVIETEQKYLFERIEDNGIVRYREIFTGFIADTNIYYFDLPYVTNIEKLNDVVKNIVIQVSKYGCLLLLDEINNSKIKVKKRDK